MTDSSARRGWLYLSILLAAYAVLVVSHWNRGYLDFGDGNYMYISWRLSQGATLYRDVLAPQPPLHLLIGAALAWVGDRVLTHPLWAFRLFSLLLHMGTVLLVVWAAQLVAAQHDKDTSRRRWLIGCIAATLYLLMPIGFWWSLGYQTQPLLIALLLIMFIGILKLSPALLLVSGAAASLAMLTNMTAVPYVAIAGGWLLLRRTRISWLFLLPAIVITLAGATAAEMATGAYIDNVIKNQAGAFPRPDVLAQSGQTLQGYIINKLHSEGSDVLRLEGGFVLLGAVGLMILARRGKGALREFVILFSLASVGSLVYVSKGGTVDYVFSLAEPYLAIAGALALYSLASLTARATPREPLPADTTPLLYGAATAVAVVALFYPGVIHSFLTLRQRTYELTERETNNIVRRIELAAPPGAEIIAPPHLAFMARRKIVEDYSEHLLWRLKYMNERLDKKPARAVATVERMAEQIRHKRLPILILDMNQTGTLPEIATAVEAHYKPLLKEPYQTLNTPLQYFVPK